MTFWHTWRAALRIARRDALRAKGRSILVVAMIALPILGVSALDLTFRSSQLTVEEELDRTLGSNDALYVNIGDGSPIEQPPTGDGLWTGDEYEEGEEGQPHEESPAEDAEADGTDEAGAEETDEAGADEAEGAEWDGAAERASLDALLPDAEVLTWTTASWHEVRTAKGIARVDILEYDTSHPAAAGPPRLRDGRFPREADEVAVTGALLAEGGLEIGSEVTFPALGEDRAFRVVGSYEHASRLDHTEVLARPGVLAVPLVEAAEESSTPEVGHLATKYLVTRPGGVSWSDVLKANEHGWHVTSRAVHLDPPPDHEVPYLERGEGPYQAPLSAEVVAVIVTTVSLIILEICLLAGPAFAVGARRSRRMLGLVGANGGDRRHIRAIMLASGVVLGATAAVIGIVVGLLLTVLTRPWLEELTGSRFGALTLRPLELLAIAAIGVLTGLLAALIPAVTAARTPVLDSLTGRRGVRTAGRLLPTVGGGAFVLGAALALVGAMTMDNPTVVAAGAIAAQLGLVAMTPKLVGAFGRLGRRLPLSGRLALRDAVRNRSRTAPAVAAVLAAVSGSVAVATMVASDEVEQRAEYHARLPHGMVSVEALELREEAALPAARDAVEQQLRIAERVDFARLAPDENDCGVYGWSEEGDCGAIRVVLPPENECDDEAYWRRIEEYREVSDDWSKFERDWRCDHSGNGQVLDVDVVVAGPELLRVMGLTDPEAVAALERGEAVAFDRTHVDADGEVTIAVHHTDPWRYGQEEDASGEFEPAEPDRTVSFPAVFYDTGDDEDDRGLPLVLPPDAAAAAGLTTVDHGSLMATAEVPGSAEEQALRGALRDISGAPYVDVETGFSGEYNLVLLALALFATVITLGAAGIATGLAQADSEHDLTTLAAVGAPPRVRRTLSGLQCAVIATMGVVLGTVAGVIPALGLRLVQYRAELADFRKWGGPDWTTRPEPFIEVPWLTILQLLIVVPLLAGVMAALLTRSRISLTRRAG